MYEAARAHVCTRVPMRVEARGFLSHCLPCLFRQGLLLRVCRFCQAGGL